MAHQSDVAGEHKFFINFPLPSPIAVHRMVRIYNLLQVLESAGQVSNIAELKKQFCDILHQMPEDAQQQVWKLAHVEDDKYCG